MESRTVLPTDQNTPLHRISSIQYLRAVAACGVALLHTLNIVEYAANITIPLKVSLASGVDLFFVISGYIIYSIFLQLPVPPTEFFYNRVTRILPLYWLVTILYVPVMFSSKHLAASYSLPNLVRSFLFIPYADGPVLGVGWTLNYEMFFYAIFTATIMIARSNILAFTVIIYTALVALGTALNQNDSNSIAWFSKSLVCEFVFGMIVAKIYLDAVYKANTLEAVVMILLAGVAIVITSSLNADIERSALRPVLFGLPALMILMAMISIERNGFRFSNDTLITLGNASYSIYLVHIFPVLGIGLFYKMSWWSKSLLGNALFVALSIFSIVIFGLGTHLWVEKPLLRLARRLSPFRHSKRISINL
jgi:exopolysaccharide production protein ExoZ